MIKRTASIILSLSMIILLCGCGNDSVTKQKNVINFHIEKYKSISHVVFDNTSFKEMFGVDIPENAISRIMCTIRIKNTSEVYYSTWSKDDLSNKKINLKNIYTSKNLKDKIVEIESKDVFLHTESESYACKPNIVFVFTGVIEDKNTK